MGIIAAQSIGEPGTQLTMRTFHTGGVAGADITHGLPRVVELFEARKPKGLAKIAEQDGVVSIEETDKALTVVITDKAGEEHRHAFPRRTRLFVAAGEKITAGRQLNEGSVYPHELLAIRGRTETEQYLVKEVQEVYKSQGVDINDKHIELIVRQMLKKVRVDQKGDTDYLPGQFVDRFEFAKVNDAVIDKGGEAAQFEDIILGITKASLNTDSFLSAASFQETTKVLTDAALEGKTDRLNGLKENVIIGKLIPAATGLKRYRRIEIEPSEPLPRAIDDVGLLDQDEIAAELGLSGGEGFNGGYGQEFDADLASLEKIGAGGSDPGFVEELADLEVPEEPSGSTSSARTPARARRGILTRSEARPCAPVGDVASRDDRRALTDAQRRCFAAHRRRGGALPGGLVRPGRVLAALARAPARRRASASGWLGRARRRRAIDRALAQRRPRRRGGGAGAAAARVELRFRAPAGLERDGSRRRRTAATARPRRPAALAGVIGDPVWTGGTTAVAAARDARAERRAAAPDRRERRAGRAPARAGRRALRGGRAAPGRARRCQPGRVSRRSSRAGLGPGAWPRRGWRRPTGRCGWRSSTTPRTPTATRRGEVPAMLLRDLRSFIAYVRRLERHRLQLRDRPLRAGFEARAGGIDEPVVGAHAGGYNLVLERRGGARARS